MAQTSTANLDTVAHVVENVASDGVVPEGYVKSRIEGYGYLPPLHRIKLPKTQTQSALVRWLFKQGYSVGDIHKGLGVRYQQVRNMVVTQPKRAAREDLPADGIELADLEDVVDTLLGDELERSFGEERATRKRAAKRQARAHQTHGLALGDQMNGADLDEDEVDEITEQED